MQNISRRRAIALGLGLSIAHAGISASLAQSAEPAFRAFLETLWPKAQAV
jgi:hypothetical protein